MSTGRILLLLAAFAAALAAARASPLDADSCSKLLNEHGELESAGVEADMAKGPAWARANLGLEKMERIRRFIEVTEQLVFRCRQKSLVSLRPEDDGDQKDKDDDKDDAPRVPAKAGDKAKNDGKGKAAPGTTTKKKSPEPARKAAVQPSSKSAPAPKPKPAPSTAKPPQKQPPEKAKAPPKQPPTAATKGAPKARDDD
jgi:hypothetical protein